MSRAVEVVTSRVSIPSAPPLPRPVMTCTILINGLTLIAALVPRPPRWRSAGAEVTPETDIVKAGTGSSARHRRAESAVALVDVAYRGQTGAPRLAETGAQGGV